MFIGEYNHTIDAKGRIIVPSKLREDLGEEFVITRGLEGCLFVYPDSEWKAFVASLKELPGTQKTRNLKRAFLAAAEYCTMDKQGRTVVPSKLREYAGIDKDVVLVGLDNRIEVWDKDKWDEINDYSDIDEAAEELAGYGLKF